MQTNSKEHKALRERIKSILSVYGDWIWNDPAKVFSLVWKYEIKSMMDTDPKLLSAEGFLNGMWRNMVTDPALIYEVFKELQLINNNANSNTLNMKNVAEKIPHRIPVLAHLKKHGTITGLQAWRLYGCYRLSDVVHRLNKNPEINIECKIVDGERYGEYKLIA